MVSAVQLFRVACWRLVLLVVCLTRSATIGIAFLASAVGGVITLSNLILGVCGGPLLGVFLLGMLTRRAGPQAALVVRDSDSNCYNQCHSLVDEVTEFPRQHFCQSLIVGPTFMLYYGVNQFVCPNGAVGGNTNASEPVPPICSDSMVFTWSVASCICPPVCCAGTRWFELCLWAAQVSLAIEYVVVLRTWVPCDFHSRIPGQLLFGPS